MEDTLHASSARTEATIRRAQPEEEAALSDLSFQSKTYWGYDAAFMDACRDDVTITPAAIREGAIYVIEESQKLIGYYELRTANADEVTLHTLCVEPTAIGHGFGRLLWRHAVETAREFDFSTMVLYSEPHAEGFYQAMGAIRVGEVLSTAVPGRTLPLMRFALT